MKLGKNALVGFTGKENVTTKQTIFKGKTGHLERNVLVARALIYPLKMQNIVCSFYGIDVPNDLSHFNQFWTAVSTLHFKHKVLSWLQHNLTFQVLIF